MLNQCKTVLAIAFAIALTQSVYADQTPEEQATAVMKKSDQSDAGFSTQSVRLTMTLSDPRGRKTVRELQIDTLEKEGEGNGDRSLTRFFSPANVEGTALLSHARILEADNQWLYLPALRRVKRISSSNKSGPFVGSEFAFEDLTGNEFGKFKYTLLDTIEERGMTLYKIECVPLYERSGYTKQICYVDNEAYQVRRIEFYNRGKKLFKTLKLEDYRKYEGGYWRSHRQEMKNHITNKSTTLKFGDFKFGTELDKRDFEPSALEDF